MMAMDCILNTAKSGVVNLSQPSLWESHVMLRLYCPFTWKLMWRQETLAGSSLCYQCSVTYEDELGVFI